MVRITFIKDYVQFTLPTERIIHHDDGKIERTEEKQRARNQIEESLKLNQIPYTYALGETHSDTDIYVNARHFASVQDVKAVFAHQVVFTGVIPKGVKFFQELPDQKGQFDFGFFDSKGNKISEKKFNEQLQRLKGHPMSKEITYDKPPLTMPARKK